MAEDFDIFVVVSTEQIQERLTGLALVVLAYKTRMSRVPPKLGVATSHKDIVGGSWASLTFMCLHMVDMCMRKDIDIEMGMT